MKIFKLPDLGEGLPDAEISEWHVKVGDEVKVDQPLVSMETAKALVEVPSPIAGKIVKLFGQPKDIIKTGSALVEFESIDAAASVTVAGKLESTDFIIDEPTIIRSKTNRAQTQEKKENENKHLQDASYEALTGTRRVMAQMMEKSHSEVVPVTVMEDAILSTEATKKDITVLIMQAMIKAIAKEPSLNAWYDGKGFKRRILPEVHLGLAMDTQDGLFVPVIHHAQNLDSAELRTHLNELKAKVLDRSISQKELQGATIILSNFGKFAGRYANPVVVPPMVAILGAGKLREEVVNIQGKPEIRPVLPLAMTVDHRAVTGGEVTRFLGLVIETLEKA